MKTSTSETETSETSTGETATGETATGEPSSAGADEAAAQRPRWRALVSAWLIALAALAPPAAMLLARWHWALDAWTSFPIHALLALLVATAWAAWLRVRSAAIVAGVAAIVVGMFAWSERGSGPVATDRPTLKVMSANVLSSNTQTDAFEGLIRADPPDVLAVLEVNGRWAMALNNLVDIYPHRVPLPRADNFGLMVLSRKPIEMVPVRLDDETDSAGATPSIEIRVPLGASTVRVLTTHPVPPVGTDNWRLRNEQLAQVARFAQRSTAPLVVMGDLNTPPWSPAFRDLIDQSELSDARMRGNGWSTTWNARRFWMRTPIDYVLTSPELTAVSYRTQRIPGSDHLAVRANIALTEE